MMMKSNMTMVGRVAMTLLALVISATAWAGSTPTGNLEICTGGHGSIHLLGWCEDPDEPSTPLEVYVYVKDANNTPVADYNPIVLTANKKRNGEDNQWHYNGYDDYLFIANAGTYKVDVIVNDATGDASVMYSMKSVQVSAPYTVNYNANGGSNAPAQQLKGENVPLTLNSAVPTRNGNNFLRWTTASNGGGTSYSPGATYTANANLTLYAQWMASDFPGSGTQADPYVISSDGEWNLFANNVNNGNTYSGKYLRLDADINVSIMAGTNDSPFSGTFDGNCHTMALSINGTGTGGGHPNIAVAPFRYVNDATFKNLNLTGTVTRNDYPSDANVSLGGLIGIVTQYRSATIISCHSNVSLNYNFSWEEDEKFVTGYQGGFIGWSDGEVTFNDCLFDGSLAGRPRKVGGFVGWYCWGSMILNNCLMNGTGNGLNGYALSTKTFCGIENQNPTLYNCYYTRTIGDAQGTMTSATGETLRAQLGDGWILSGSAVVPGRVLTLSVDADNRTAIAAAAESGTTYDRVALNGLTLYRDGTWNTIVLPFNLATLTGTPLAGATLKTLSSSNFTTQNDGTLTMTFADATSIEAGKPYIIKWNSGSTIENPVFTNVTISNATANVSTTYADFNGSYKPFSSGPLFDAHNTYRKAMHAALSIVSPSKVGYTFTEWCTDAARQIAVTTIPFTSSGNITLYAKWTLGEQEEPSGIPYLKYNTETEEFETLYAASYNAVNSKTTTWNNNKWYVVQGNVTISSRITVNGTVNLILCDDATLTASAGICVAIGKTLNIYAQSDGTGRLNANASINQQAGIGSNGAAGCGTITIHGGVITATCTGGHGSGIGAGGQPAGTFVVFNNSGHITIHGGEITATGDWGAGIGGGYFGESGNITITGGTITATGGANSAGIGGGCDASANTITITGGTIYATGHNGQAIGHGSGSTSSGTLNLGDMRVYAKDATTPVAYTNRANTCHSDYAKLMFCTSHDRVKDICRYCGTSFRRVTYNSNNATSGTVPTDANNYEPGQTVTVLGNTGNLIRNGYVFGGWNTKADGSGISYNDGAAFIIKNSTTLYANWLPATYLYHNADNTETIANAANSTTSNIVLNGYTLYRDGSWNTLCLPFNLNVFDGSPLEGATVKTLVSSEYNNGALTVSFAQVSSIEAGKPYIVKWNTPLGSNITNPEFINVRVYSNTKNVSAGNVTFIGSYTPFNADALLFDAHNSSGDAMHAAISISTPNNSGYTLNGWFTNSGLTTSATTIPFTSNGNVTLYAKWTPNTYTVRFHKNYGGEDVYNDQAFTYDVAQNLSANTFSRSGFTFVGWGTTSDGTAVYSDKERVSNLTIIQNDVVNLYAIWKLTYTISYDLAGGSVATSNPTTYTEVSSDITLVNPTRDGYTFAGWTGTDLDEPTITVTIAKGSTGNRSYTATWVPNYALTYDLAGGTASNPTYYCVLSDAITLNNPIRTGHTFAGWTGTDLNGPTMTVTIPHGSTGDRSYTATWTITTYTITYDLAGGSVETDNPISYTYIDKDITLVNPTREGYYFVGWTGTDLTDPTQNVTISAGSLGNRSYTAVWTKHYTISYEGLVEGTFPTEHPTTYTVLSETFTLVNPVRDLYDFAGWTGTGLTGPTMTVTIPKGSTGNLTYTASWSLKEGIYVSYNTETGEYETHGASNPAHVESTSATTIGTAGQVTWYMVKDAGVTASERLTVRGTVNLILADGASLKASKGITVHSGNTLNIYGQAGGTGSLNATVYSNNYAAIGTENNSNGVKDLGTITIHGGNITATNNTYWSAGIGGGVGCGGGSVAIYGGTVHASASSNPDYGLQEAIGKGSAENVSVSKTLADGLCVYVGNNTTPVSYENRIGSLANKVVRVAPCTEHNWDNNRCTYCHAYHHHQIIYDGNDYTDGDVPEVATCNVTTGIVVAKGTIAEAGTMERNGYTFTGWNTEADGSGTDFAPGETVTLRSDLTLYAQWSLNEYTITYDLAGGTLPEGKNNPTTYTVDSDEITLVKPTREGYAFVGWTGTDLDAATEDVTIYYGSTGNRSYTATWLGLPPEVSLVKNSLTPYGATVKWTGSSDSYTLQYSEGSPFILSEDFEGGSLPEGWTTSGSYWAVGSGTGHEDYTGAATGNYNATCYISEYDVEDYLITPVMNLSGVASASLTFNYRNVDWSGDLNELHVFYRVDGGSWNELYSNTDEVSSWTLVTIPLQGLAANYQIGFKCYSNYGYGMGIDDVKVVDDNLNLVWTTLDSNAHSPYTFDNLELETAYSVRVIGTTEGQSKMSNILSFTTLERYPKPFGFEIVENTLTAHSATVSWKGFSDSYNIRLGEDNYTVNADFETGDLSQVEFTTTTDYPWTVALSGHDGSCCAKSATGNDDETSALELEVNLPSDLTLTFSAKVSSEEGCDYAYFSIDGTDVIDGISGDGNWIDYSYPLTAGTHTLRWYYTKDGGSDYYDDCFYVDDIRITGGMTVLSTYTSNTTNYNFTDLDSEKTYLVQVQGVSENVTTDWSDTYAFTTTTSCPKPTDLIARTPDAHSVELGWTENGTATQWQICVNGDMNNLMTVSTNPYTLSGLSGDTEYTVKVRAYNNADEQSRWSNEVTFTTGFACFAPTDLTTGAISSRSVELSWKENGSSNKWVIEYSTDDEFKDAQSVEVTGTPNHTLTALTSGYSYYVRVRAINSDNELSRWSDDVCFDAKQVIGDGGSDTNDNLPLNTEHKYSLSQQIYTASELGEAGFIESIDFYAECYATRNIDIYMVSTSKSSFESGTDWVAVTASDLVLSGEVQFNNDGWKTITLDRYFEYDGTHNIVLVVDDNTGSDTWNYYHAFRVFDATRNAIFVNGSSDCDPLNPSSGTVLDVKNQIRLAISVSPKPTDVTATDISATSATISWNGKGGNYDVKYREATVASTWLSDALFYENFEDGLGNWTTYAAGYSGSSTNWQKISPQSDTQTFNWIYAHSRNYVAMSRSNYGAVDNWLVSPQMTLGDVLKFWAHDDGTHHEHFEVYVSTKTNAISDFEKVADPSIGNSSWNEITVDLSAFAGQEGYIAIRHNDTGKNYLLIDDFGVYETKYDYTYGTETTLTCTTNSCELTGLSAGTTYEVQVQADGGADGTSQWSSPIMFTTDAPEAVVINESDGIGQPITEEEEITVPSLDYERDLSAPADEESADAVIGGTPVYVYTLCLPYAPATGDGIKYYTLSSSSDQSLKFVEIDGDPVADTPYLVTVSEATGVGGTVSEEVTLKKEADNSVEPQGCGYKFVGTTIGLTNAEAAEKGAYILQDENQWRRVTTDNKGAYIPPFRAYIVATGSGARLQLGTDFGEASDIQSLQLVDRDGTEHWYDLNGRRINKPAMKGVYINNGNRVLIK